MCDVICSVVLKCWLIHGDLNMMHGTYNINVLYVVYI